MNTTHSQFRFAPRGVAGFTLIELMVTLSVVAITLAVGVPSFQGIVSDNRLSSAANGLIGAINIARSEAIKRGRSVAITPTGTDWNDGGTIAVVTPAETIKSFSASTGITISMASAAYTFLPSGFVSLAAAEELMVCDSGRTGETGRKISISVSGRVAVEPATCS